MKKERLYYIENLRIFLIILVILQHVVRAYGSVVWWFVRDDRAPLLEHFTAVNSSFFMSFFFIISFYFMPVNYDKKGVVLFHRMRFFKLFIPLNIYIFVIMPLMMYFNYITVRVSETIEFPKYYYSIYLGLGSTPSNWNGPSWPEINAGHLWFVEHLIIYGILYSLFRFIMKKNQKLNIQRLKSLTFPRNSVILIFILILSAITFLIRLQYPLYKWIGFLEFIQIEFAHFPFYISMFFLGICAARNNWFEQIPRKTGKLWFTIGILGAALVALQPLDSNSFGGWSLMALLYAVSETFSCIGLIIGLLYFFREYCNKQGNFLKLLSHNTYMAYLIHIPIIAYFQYLILPADWNPYIKFFFLSIVSLPVVYGTGYLLGKLPYAKKYL